jgi:hypothetical protein
MQIYDNNTYTGSLAEKIHSINLNMATENNTKRGSNLTPSLKRKVPNHFRGSHRIKHFVELTKMYKLITTGSDKLSIADINCAKFFTEPMGRNEN